MPPAPDRKPASPDSARTAPLTLAAVALVALASALAWSGSLSAPFTMDDQPSILENASIRRLWPPGWQHPPATVGETVGGRPVLNFTLALNHAAGGLDVRGYRLTNVFIHALAALALFGLVRRTLGQETKHETAGRDRLIPPLARNGQDTTIPSSDKAAGLFALVVALLWFLHPLQTESVTYVVQRAESLCGLFYLFTLYAFVRGVGCSGTLRAPENNATAVMDRRYNSGWLALSIVSCLLGMGTKEVMGSAPLLVLLCDRAFVAGSFAAAWRARRGYYLALASTWVVLALLVFTNLKRGGSAGFGTEIGAWAYALTQCHAMMLYLKLAFWPSGQVFDYGTSTVATLADVGWQAALLLILLAVVIWTLVRKPALGTLGAGFFLILAPSSSIVPVATQTIAEHRMYLPLAAVLLLFCAAARAALGFLSRPAWISGAVAAGVIVALGGATIARNRVYRSELALWQDTATKRPDNPRAHHNLGLALAQAGRPDEAMGAFRRAIALQPEHALAHFQLGTIHLARRQWSEAAGELQLAVAADPHHTAARVNLGQALGELGRIDEAIAQYEAALAIEPGAADVRTNLGAALIVRGRLDEAEQLLRAALASTPGLAETHYHLGTVLAKKDAASAEAEFAEAIRIKPELPAAQFALGNLRARQQRFAEAMTLYQNVLRLDPAHVQARNNLANCQLVTGRLVEAIANYEAVLRVRPGDPTATRNLALAREQLR